MMFRRLLSGTALAACAAVVVLIGTGSELEHVALLGVALGGVVGLAPHDQQLGKLAGFVLGFGTAWIGFGVRGPLLQDTTAGRAGSVFLVIFVCGVIAAITAGKVPFWSALLGAVAIVGANERSYTLSSAPHFLSTSTQAAATVLLAAGFGFLGSTLVDMFIATPTSGPKRGRRRRHGRGDPLTAGRRTVGSLMGGAPE